MKAFLMFKDRDFDLQTEIPAHASALIQDLELGTLLGAMAQGDEFLFEVSKKALLSGLENDVETILYRQGILTDCLKHPSVIRELYDVALGAITGEKKAYFLSYLAKYPGSILSRSIEVLGMFVALLERLREIADEHMDGFESEGLKRFFAMVQTELDRAYFARVRSHLRELKFEHGVLVSAQLGKGNKGTRYILRRSQEKRQSWIDRIFGKKPPVYILNIPPRDESGARALSELRDRAINLVANALAQSADHILSFFTLLRTELAFYVGCLNLHDQLDQIGEPSCFPVPMAVGGRRHAFEELYDIGLALSLKQKVVGNDGNIDDKDLVIITGANQGGKSTFLRSVGLAQLMMQCGMFVPAKSFVCHLCDGLFTHFKREEDVTMKSGKLDEELSRMSEIVDKLRPHSMVLFNESFAATNEREGSEIAEQIVSALTEKGIKVFFVTHLYEFAHRFAGKKMKNVLFLRAERDREGKRTFRLVEGEPLPTSYGQDLYNTIFGIPACST